MYIQIKTNLPTELFNVDNMNKSVANDVLNEIKNLIYSGKNTSNQSLHPKVDGSIPTFVDTGLLLDSMKTTSNSNGFKIFIDNGSRVEVVSYLHEKWNWTIFQPSKYLEAFTANRYRFYINESIKKLNK